MFPEALEADYITVIYERWSRGDDSYDVKMSLAKARVAPLKSVSIPLLELRAAVLTAKMVRIAKWMFRIHKLDRSGLDGFNGSNALHPQCRGQFWYFFLK